MLTIERARSSTSSAPRSIWPIDSMMSNGLQETSPASAPCRSANGSISWIGWNCGRSILDACRIACGPNRAPGRKLTPESNGIPRIATSQRSMSRSSGSRTNVEAPAYRGTTVPLTGWIGGSSILGILTEHVPRAALRELVGDDVPLDLGRPLPDPVDPELAEEPLRDVLTHVAA